MYNATSYSRRADGSLVSTGLVEVDDEGFVVRSAGYWTPQIGTRAYDSQWRASRLLADHTEIVHDGGAGYRRRLAGLVGVEQLLDAEAAS